MGRACSTYGEVRGVYKYLVGKTEEKRPLKKFTIRWEDNIKMDLQAVGCRVFNRSSWITIGTGGWHL